MNYRMIEKIPKKQQKSTANKYYFCILKFSFNPFAVGLWTKPPTCLKKKEMTP